MSPRLLYLAGRFLVPSVFVGLGLERLLVAAGVLSIPNVPTSMGALGFSLFELLVGVAIIAGWQVRWAALALAVFIVADAFMAHAFWASPPAEVHGQYLHFLKNFSSLGGLLLLASLAVPKEAHA